MSHNFITSLMHLTMSVYDAMCDECQLKNNSRVMRSAMDSRALLSGGGDNNFQNFDIDRGMYGTPLNPFVGYKNQYSIPYQFPPAGAASENVFTIGGGSFDQHQDPTFGLKFGGTGYGNTGVGSHVQYGPPVMAAGGKGGKLKGAALSALTLLAFLFFLNLLQSCLKDQMEAMNPTVMVMSAGQRAVIARNEVQEAKKRFDHNYENPHSHSDEQSHHQQQQQQYNDYEDEVEYDIDGDDDERTLLTSTKSHKRIKGKYKSDKRHKSKTSSSTIGPKLQNLQLIRSSI